MSSYDYLPFGVQLDGRTIEDEDYRYGFNGMEKDDEVSGKGNIYTAEYWQYDSRLGRRWNIDPMFTKYPWQSPYLAFNNNPLCFIDPLGLEGEGPDDSGLPKNIPTNPNEGDIHEDEHGYSWKYMKNKEGSLDWARSGGSFDDVVIRPESVKAELIRESKRIEANKTSIMGQFLNPGMGESKLIPFKDNPSSPYWSEWQEARANHAALENFMEMYIGIGTAPLGGGIGTIRSAAASIIVGSTISFGSQMIENQGDIGSVDWAGVGAGGLSGVFKKPWFGATIGGVVDAGFDYTNEAGLITPMSKPTGNMVNDLFWGSIGNYGSASFAKYPKFYNAVGSTITTVPTTTLNTITNEELGY